MDCQSVGGKLSRGFLVRDVSRLFRTFGWAQRRTPQRELTDPLPLPKSIGRIPDVITHPHM